MSSWDIPFTASHISYILPTWNIARLSNFSQIQMNGCDCWGPDGRLDTKIYQIDLSMSHASFIIIWHFMSYDAYDVKIWHKSIWLTDGSGNYSFSCFFGINHYCWFIFLIGFALFFFFIFYYSHTDWELRNICKRYFCLRIAFTQLVFTFISDATQRCQYCSRSQNIRF
jgi:hypothetical protein